MYQKFLTNPVSKKLNIFPMLITTFAVLIFTACAKEEQTFKDMIEIYQTLPKNYNEETGDMAPWPVYKYQRESRSWIRDYRCIVHDVHPPSVILDHENNYLEITDDCYTGQYGFHKTQVSVFKKHTGLNDGIVVFYMERDAYNDRYLSIYKIKGLQLIPLDFDIIFPEIEPEMFVDEPLSIHERELMDSAELFGSESWTYNLPRFGTDIEVMNSWLGCSELCSPEESEVVTRYLKERVYKIILQWEPEKSKFIVGRKVHYEYHTNGIDSTMH